MTAKKSEHERHGYFKYQNNKPSSDFLTRYTKSYLFYGSKDSQKFIECS